MAAQSLVEAGRLVAEISAASEVPADREPVEKYERVHQALAAALSQTEH